MDGLRTRLETVEVAGKFENAAVVDADALEDAVSVEKPMVVDRDHCVLLINEMTIEPNLHARLQIGGAQCNDRHSRRTR